MGKFIAEVLVVVCYVFFLSFVVLGIYQLDQIGAINLRALNELPQWLVDALFVGPVCCAHYDYLGDIQTDLEEGKANLQTRLALLRALSPSNTNGCYWPLEGVPGGSLSGQKRASSCRSLIKAIFHSEYLAVSLNG